MSLYFKQASPEAVGIPSFALIRMIGKLKQFNSLNSIMILRHGKCCAEGWWTPYAPEIPHTLFSLSKSFTSLAVGFAQQEGKLSIHDRLTTHLPEYDSVIRDGRMHDITLRHLLIMASGHDSCACPQMFAEPTGDWARGFLSSQLTYLPGERFIYNSAATYMLSVIVRKVTGMNVREYLLPRLFEPLSIKPGIWENCPHGINVGGWGLYLTTEDIAKFAQFLLQNGSWNGKQLISSDFLHDAVSQEIDTAACSDADWKQGYGYQFWLSRHGFRADGAAGQLALVIPEADMAIAITSGIDRVQDLLTVIWELLPELSDTVLPEQPEEQKKLVKLLSTLEMPIAPNARKEWKTQKQEWMFEDNSAKIIGVSLEIGTDSCRLTFRKQHGEETLLAGFGFRCNDNVLQLNDHLPRRVSASAGWTKEGALELHLCCYETAFREVFRIDPEYSSQPLTGTARFCTFRQSFLPPLTVRSPGK
jgi:hypothetical protein